MAGMTGGTFFLLEEVENESERGCTLLAFFFFPTSQPPPAFVKSSTCWTVSKRVKIQTHTHTHTAYALYNKPV